MDFGKKREPTCVSKRRHLHSPALLPVELSCAAVGVSAELKRPSSIKYLEIAIAARDRSRQAPNRHAVPPALCRSLFAVTIEDLPDDCAAFLPTGPFRPDKQSFAAAVGNRQRMLLVVLTGWS